MVFSGEVAKQQMSDGSGRVVSSGTFSLGAYWQGIEALFAHGNMMDTCSSCSITKVHRLLEKTLDFHKQNPEQHSEFIPAFRESVPLSLDGGEA